MKPFQRIGRRQFLHDSALGLGAAPLIANAALSEAPAHPGLPQSGPASNFNGLKMQARFGSTDTVWILREPNSSFPEQLASCEVARGLRNLGLAQEPVQALLGGGEQPSSGFIFSLSVRKGGFNNPEAYEVSHESGGGKASRVRLTGATPQAVLYAVFDFLERQGAFFGLDGEVYPLEPARALNLPPLSHPWQTQPRFNVRGLVPWPDFLNCVTVYNREDWRAYLEAMLRMRFNTLGVHVYSGMNQWVESFLSFEYAGAGHLAYTDTSATNRWGYLPERTSRFGMGSPDFFSDEVFGSEATTKARSCWEAEELAQQLWREAFQYAKQLGIRTGVGFEPYQVPDEIYRATPPEAHYASGDPKIPGPRIAPESVAAKDILEARLGRLLETYPTLDYVWLWEDEGMSWASQKQNVPLSVTAFKQAYDFLKRHAPEKRLVISGWGGVVRHFAYFHKVLPEEIIFSSLNDNLGWDPVSEEYGKLEARERWPIPWLEDDPAMWLPQFHVSRFVRDMDLAEQYGCQGLLGIHWRHRIMNIDAGFQAGYSWNKELTPTRFFQVFAAAQAREPRAGKLAKVLEDTDRDRLVLCSWTGEVKNGHSEIHEYIGQLASMHNKYERLALYRLRASMKEFLGELPPETERMFAEVRQPDVKATPRAFVPTRPTVLRKGEHARISAVVPGAGQVVRVTLFTRAKDSDQWSSYPMSLARRRTYAGEIKWQEAGPLTDYYVQAEIDVGGVKKALTSPPEAPTRFYTVTLL